MKRLNILLIVGIECRNKSSEEILLEIEETIFIVEKTLGIINLKIDVENMESFSNLGEKMITHVFSKIIFSLRYHGEAEKLVPQNVFLFEMSVFENIRVGNTDMNIEEFEENLQELQDYGFLEGIDMNAMIINNGKNLSKGQIQQIAIARTLVKKHNLYIFDEATSYLDKKAKIALYALLKDKIKREICIFICHDNDFDDIINKKLILH